jgi:hypothetical protein
VENLKGRDHSEGKDVDGKLITQCIVEKLDGKLWSGCMFLGIGTIMRSFIICMLHQCY